MTLPLVLRGIGRQPVAWGAAVLTLGAALAMTLALFSVLDGLLFRPLPFRESDRLVVVDYRPVGGRTPELAYLPELDQDRLSLRARLLHSPLVAEAGQTGLAFPFSAAEASAAGLQVAAVDAHFLPTLGLDPILGRTFAPEDARTPSTEARTWPEPLPVILGQGLWQRLYNADPNVLGVRELAGRTVRILGVMGSDVKFPGETNPWAAVQFTTGWPPTHVRLVPGATVDQLASQFPELRFRQLRDAVRPGSTGAMPMLFGAAVLLLLVAGLQVAAWIGTGVPEQFRDLGMRRALGATWGDLYYPLMMQNLIAGSLAGGVAWLASRPITYAIISLLPVELTHGQYLEPTARATLVGGVAISAGAVLLSAVPLALVWRTAPLDLMNLRMWGRAIHGERLRRGVLVVQMTLAAMLLYVTGLAAHSLRVALTFDYGFDHERVLVILPPRSAGSNEGVKDPANLAFKTRIQESVNRLAGTADVLAAASVFAGPLAVGNHNGPPSEVEVAGEARRRQPRMAFGNAVGPDFVRALGGSLLEGRGLDAADYAGRSDVMLVNETLARQIAPSLDIPGGNVRLAVLGRRLRTVGGEGEVVGVIKDLVDRRLDVEPVPQYFKVDRHSLASAAILVRVAGSTDEAIPVLQQALAPIWGVLPARHFSKLADRLDPMLRPYRAQALLLGLIVACAMPIVGIGLTSALIASVRFRAREIAIRLAIGAAPQQVRALVVRQAASTLLIGLGLGTGLGVGVGRLLAHQFFGTRLLDLVTVFGVACALALLGMLAVLVPARHAVNVDPVSALRDA